MSSPAKARVLQILARAKAPLSLRSLISLSELSPRPIQLAVSALKKQKLIEIKWDANRQSIRLLNLPKSLHLFFNAIEKEEIENRAVFLEARAKTLLSFQEEAHKISRKLRNASLKKNKK